MHPHRPPPPSAGTRPCVRGSRGVLSLGLLLADAACSSVVCEPVPGSSSSCQQLLPVPSHLGDVPHIDLSPRAGLLHQVVKDGCNPWLQRALFYRRLGRVGRQGQWGRDLILCVVAEWAGPGAGRTHSGAAKHAGMPLAVHAAARTRIQRKIAAGRPEGVAALLPNPPGPSPYQVNKTHPHPRP